MHLITIATYPFTAVDAVSRKFLDVLKDEPLPDYVRMTAIYTEFGGKGINVYTPIDIDDGHEADGVKAVVKWYTHFFGIEGYEVISRIVYTVEEALPLIGLSM